jgi:hypothetical protein
MFGFDEDLVLCLWRRGLLSGRSGKGRWRGGRYGEVCNEDKGDDYDDADDKRGACKDIQRPILVRLSNPSNYS